MIDYNNIHLTNLFFKCEEKLEEKENEASRYKFLRKINENYIFNLLRFIDDDPGYSTKFKDIADIQLKEEEIKFPDGNKDLDLYIRDVDDFMHHPMIKRCLIKLIYSLMENLQLCLGLLHPGDSAQSQSFYEFKLPVTGFPARLEPHIARLRALSFDIPPTLKESIRSKWLKPDDIASLLVDIALDISKCMDRHLIHEIIFSAMQFGSIPLSKATTSKNKLIYHKKIADEVTPSNLYDQLHRHGIPNLSSTEDYHVVDHVLNFDLRCPKTTLEEDHADSFLEMIIKSAQIHNESNKSKYNTLIVSPKIWNYLIAIAMLTHRTDLKDFDQIQEKKRTIYGYKTTVKGIDIIENHLLTDKLALLCSNKLLSYGVSSWPSIKIVRSVNFKELKGLEKGLEQSLDDNKEVKYSFVLEMRDCVGIGLARDSSNEIIEHPAILINLLDEINWEVSSPKNTEELLARFKTN